MSDVFSPSTDELLVRNQDFARDLHDPDLASPPTAQLAVVACMDARIDTLAVLGLKVGESHTMRNAGGVITDDVIRSLCLSQRELGTREIILLHHTDCGLQGVDEAEFRDELNAELGVKPTWALESFGDPYEDVRQSMQRITMSPFVPYTDHLRGFVYQVADGLLHEVRPVTT